ncbi:putative TonB-dependent receptor precursor [Enhygromyxa salina]|uniref:Putative TonB-dependent receptor n=1 Tax=Enhygromyxa salina TaxID=215803 RepID=A0A2S9XEH7_9BACT|nr:TonB-dependent receptor [Enhygromyxa salina]PRP91274.1 putative TonB-dependent receptor precursor [Enhygromyxa salina]
MIGSLALLAILAAPPEAPPSVATTEDDCTLRWRVDVVDEDTGEPVPGATVEIQPSDQAPRRYQTNDAGTLLVRRLCPGPMRVSVSKSDHASSSETVELDMPETLSVVGLPALHDHHSEHVILIHDEGQSTVGSSEALAGADLAKTRGQGLADAISTMSGVTTLRGTAGGMAKPVIRGQVGRRNLIIFDGIRHEGQKWGLDHAPEIDPNAAGRITVVKGAATTRFGPDAIGGVVLVDPRPMLRSPGVAGEVSLLGMSNALGGGGAFRIDHAPARAPGLSWRVEGNIARHRAVVTPDYPLDNTGALTWNAGGRVGYLSEHVDIIAGYRLLRTQAGICSCLRVSTNEEFQIGIARSVPPEVDLYSTEFAIERPRQEVWHHLAHAHARVGLGEAGELHLIYAYQFNDRSEFESVRSNITGPQIELRLGTHRGELHYEHVAVDLGWGWALVGTLGGEVNYQVNAFDSANTLIPDYRQWSGGAFAVERFVGEQIEFEFGARYEGLGRTGLLSERDFLGQRAGGRLDESACTRDADGGAECQQQFHTPSASAGLIAHPSRKVPELNLRLDLNSSARIPAIDESYMNGAAPSFPILGLGDSHLGVERTWGAATGIGYGGDWLELELAAYTNYIDDYIYFTPEPQEGQCAPLSCTTRGPFPVFVFRPVDALFVGGELRFDLRAPRLPLELSGDAAWVRAWDLSPGETYLTYVPADRYGLHGRWLWPDTKVSSRGYLEIGGTFVDRQRRYDVEADFAEPPPAYVILEAGAGVEFPTDEVLMRLSLRGTNLLNQRYREYTSLLRYFADEPGWGVQLRFAVEFSAGIGSEGSST